MGPGNCVFFCVRVVPAGARIVYPASGWGQKLCFFCVVGLKIVFFLCRGPKNCVFFVSWAKKNVFLLCFLCRAEFVRAEKKMCKNCVKIVRPGRELCAGLCGPTGNCALDCAARPGIVRWIVRPGRELCEELCGNSAPPGKLCRRAGRRRAVAHQIVRAGGCPLFGAWRWPVEGRPGCAVLRDDRRVWSCSAKMSRCAFRRLDLAASGRPGASGREGRRARADRGRPPPAWRWRREHGRPGGEEGRADVCLLWRLFPGHRLIRSGCDARINGQIRGGKNHNFLVLEPVMRRRRRFTAHFFKRPKQVFAQILKQGARTIKTHFFGYYENLGV